MGLINQLRRRFEDLLRRLDLLAPEEQLVPVPVPVRRPTRRIPEPPRR